MINDLSKLNNKQKKLLLKLQEVLAKANIDIEARSCMISDGKTYINFEWLATCSDYTEKELIGTTRNVKVINVRQYRTNDKNQVIEE